MKSINGRVYNTIISGLTGLILTILGSCEDFIQIDPPKTEIISATVFSSDASAIAAIRGIYSVMMTNQSFANGQIERYAGLSSDELASHSTNPEQQEFYFNALLPVNGVLLSVFWREAYTYINNANTIIEALNKSTSISSPVRSQLEGEAKFIRAFCHFYLVNLFGDVPYITSTDYRINADANRTPAKDVYALIIKDLQDAERVLSSDFSFSNNTRSQPNKGAAQAMLARTFLYMADWQKAEQYATFLIENAALYSLEDDLNSVFLSTSKEAIWQLQPVVPEKSTTQARMFILTNDPALQGGGGLSLTDDFMDSFQPGDNRSSSWTSSFTSGTETWHFPYKYKVYASTTLTEYAMVLRLAEQYLIRAEARAHLGKLQDSIDDIDKIRQRAGLPLIRDTNPSANAAQLLLAVEQERKIELFGEWGHRWLDLKRTDRAADVLGVSKLDWQNEDALYPIPLSELLVNPQLSQNPGY